MNDVSKLQRLLSFWNRDKGNVSLITEVLREYGRLKDISAATTFFESLESANLKNSPRLIWELAQVNMVCGEFEQAVQIFESMEDDDDHHLKPYGIALGNFFLGRYQIAENALLVVIESENLPPEAHLLLAKVKYHLGELQGAYRLAQQVNRRYQVPHAETLGLLAMLSLDLQQVDAADRFADACLKTEPHHHDGLLAKASCELYLHATGSALKLASTGSQLYPNSGRMWSILGQAQLSAGQLAESYHSISQGTKLMPGHIGTWHIRGWIEILQGQCEKALVSFNVALELDRNFSETHGGLAVCYAHLGEIAKAESLVQVALRLNKNSVSGRYAQSLLSTEKGDIEDAKRRVDEILDGESHLEGVSYKTILSNFKQ